MQSFGFLVAGLTVENESDIVKGAGDTRMFETKLLLDREIAFEQKLCFGISPLIAVKQPEIVEISANRRVLKS